MALVDIFKDMGHESEETVVFFFFQGWMSKVPQNEYKAASGKSIGNSIK